jgi:hypothetical protein
MITVALWMIICWLGCQISPSNGQIGEYQDMKVWVQPPGQWMACTHQPIIQCRYRCRYTGAGTAPPDLYIVYIFFDIGTYGCTPYSATNTYSASRNTPTCSMYLCPTDYILITTCPDTISGAAFTSDPCLSFQNSTGAEVAYNDDASPSCPSGILSATLNYTVPRGVPCQTYVLHEGCSARKTCSATVYCKCYITCYCRGKKSKTNLL